LATPTQPPLYEGLRDELAAFVTRSYAAVAGHFGRPKAFEVSWENQQNEVVAPITSLGWRAALARSVAAEEVRAFGDPEVGGEGHAVYRGWNANVPIADPLGEPLEALKQAGPFGFFLDASGRDVTRGRSRLMLLRDSTGDTARGSELDAWIEHVIACAVEAAEAKVRASKTVPCRFDMEGHDLCGPELITGSVRQIAERRRQHAYAPTDAFLHGVLGLYCADAALVKGWIALATRRLAGVELPPPTAPRTARPKPVETKAATSRAPAKPRPAPELPRAQLLEELRSFLDGLPRVILDCLEREPFYDQSALRPRHLEALAKALVGAPYQDVPSPAKRFAKALRARIDVPLEAEVTLLFDRFGGLRRVLYEPAGRPLFLTYRTNKD
jgi:hypothetical protein